MFCDRAGRAGEGYEGARHHHGHRIHARLGGAVVEQAHAAHLAVLEIATHIQSLGALWPRQNEEVVAQDVDLELTAGVSLLAFIDVGEGRTRLTHFEGLDLDLSLRRRPARAGFALALDRDLPCRQPQARSGDGIVHHAPADLRLPGLGQRREHGALLGIEHSGLLELAIALECPDGSGSPVAELASDEAVIVAGPSQIELDGHAVGERKGRFARRGRRCGPPARGGAQRAVGRAVGAALGAAGHDCPAGTHGRAHRRTAQPMCMPIVRAPGRLGGRAVALRVAGLREGVIVLRDGREREE